MDTEQAPRRAGPCLSIDRKHQTRCRVAAGIALIALLSLGETVLSHRARPNPASPYVWAVLLVVGVGAAVVAAWSAIKARRGDGRRGS